MPPKFSVVALTVLALGVAGCASVPKETPQQKEHRCASMAVAAGMSQDAKNKGMPRSKLDAIIQDIERSPELLPEDKAVIVEGLNKGYVAPVGADYRIIAQKTFDDCMAK